MSKKNLRSRAQEKIAETKMPVNDTEGYKLSLDRAYELIHELQVHQVELDMQDEELKKTLAQLEASHERYFDLYDLAPIGYVTIDEKGLVLEANLTMAALLGIEKDKLIGLPFTNFIHSDSQDTYYQYRKDLYQTFIPHTFELQMLKTPDTLFWANLQGSFPTDSVRDTPVLRIVVSDITVRKRIENEKDELQKQIFNSSKLASLGVLVAGIGHEINNPLAIIYAYLELIMQAQIPLELAEPLKIIFQSVERIDKIVDGLKAYAKIDVENVDEVDVHKIISDIINLVQVVYKHENITIENICNAKKYFIKGHTGRLQQVILNLFSNAKDALIPKGGIIRIETKNEGDKIIINFTDNGTGIQKQDINRIFDAFFTTKEVGKGTGLGLGIVHSILKNMDGDITVDSKPGVGTCFTITLLTVQKNVSHIIEDEKSITKKLHGRALVVEDEIHIRTVLCNYLKGFGLEVDEASDGKAALEIIKENIYSYIITDLKMPNISGDILIKEVRNLGRKDRIIVITGDILTDYTIEQRNVVTKLSDGFLMKPFRKDDLYAALIKNLDR